MDGMCIFTELQVVHISSNVAVLIKSSNQHLNFTDVCFFTRTGPDT